MKKNKNLIFAILVIFVFGLNTALAQFPISIPKIPKISKEKKDRPKTTDNNQPNDSQTNSNQSGNQSQDNQAIEESKPQKVADECETNTVAGLFADEINKMIEDIDGYTPARGWFYDVSPTRNYLLIAISPSAKKEFQTDDKEISGCPKIVSGLEKLATVAAKKLPLRLPDKANYPVHNPAEERLMKSKINDLANHKIFYIGVKQANWLIEKNSFGIPTARYKHGMVWVRYTPNDHPYCRAYFINIIQDYAGGGRYGASYANYVDESLVGCPAGAK